MSTIELAEVELVDRDAVKLQAQTEAEGIEQELPGLYTRMDHEGAREQLAHRVVGDGSRSLEE